MSVAVIFVAPSMTWLLVTTVPSELMTMPVPAPAEPWYEDWTSMSTSESSTFAAIASGLEGPPVALLLVPEEPDELPPKLPEPPELPGPPKPPPGTNTPGVEPPPSDTTGCVPVVQRE